MLFTKKCLWRKRMRNYEFKLTPAYCLYNGIAIKRQQGSRICFLSEDHAKMFIAFVSSSFIFWYCIRRNSGMSRDRHNCHAHQTYTVPNIRQPSNRTGLTSPLFLAIWTIIFTAQPSIQKPPKKDTAITPRVSQR